jgi:hypothetical protein
VRHGERGQTTTEFLMIVGLVTVISWFVVNQIFPEHRKFVNWLVDMILCDPLFQLATCN